MTPFLSTQKQLTNAEISGVINAKYNIPNNILQDCEGKSVN